MISLLFTGASLLQYEKLQLHAIDCRKINDCASVDDKWLEFGNHCNKEHVPSSMLTWNAFYGKQNSTERMCHRIRINSTRYLI